MSEEVDKKGFFAASLIKTIVFALLSLGLLAFNFFLETKFAVGEEMEEVVFSDFDYSKANLISGDASIRFSNDLQYANPDMSVLYNEGHDYVFNLGFGQIWGNFTVATARANILVDKAVIIPNHASFNLTYSDSRINLEVFEGDVYLGFLSEGVELNEYVDQYSDIFMNRLLVPRGASVEIPVKKINQDIAPLLYSKLVKEFKYSMIVNEMYDDPWVIYNSTEDNSFRESKKQRFISEVISLGATAPDSFFTNTVFWTEKNLTFIPEKRKEMVFDHLFSFLDNAIFYANDTDFEKISASLDNFDLVLSTISPEISQSEEFYQRFDEYVNKLLIFTPQDPQYDVLTYLLNKKFLDGRDEYEVVNVFWLDVYEGIDSGPVFSEESLSNYYTYFDNTLGDLSDEEFYQMYLTYQNQLFDNLLLKYPLFYKDAYFEIKNALEQSLIGLYEDGQLKQELAQAFINSKINFLKRLKKFFFEEELDIQVAKEVFSRLVNEIDSLMPADSSSVAVIELFESQLNDYDDFWGYLTSPEYHSRSFGSTQEERYNTYLEERDKIASFIDIGEQLLGEEVPVDVDILDVVKEIEDYFAGVEGVGDLEIAAIDTVDQRYVKINAVIGGYPFEASFDRDTLLLKDIYTYNQLISDSPVKIENMLELLQGKFADLAEDFPSDEEEITIETTAERYARIFVAKIVSDYGFTVGMDDVSVADSENAIYRVKDIVLEPYKNILVTFDIIMNGEKVTNVFLKVGGEPRVLDSIYTLEELTTMIAAENDFANEVVPGGKVLR